MTDTVSLQTDHMVITPKYSLNYIAKKIKGSRLLRQEFPHLREWRTLWSPGCYHGSVGQGWEVVEKDFNRK